MIFEGVCTVCDEEFTVELSEAEGVDKQGRKFAWYHHCPKRSTIVTEVVEHSTLRMTNLDHARYTWTHEGWGRPDNGDQEKLWCLFFTGSWPTYTYHPDTEWVRPPLWVEMLVRFGMVSVTKIPNKEVDVAKMTLEGVGRVDTLSKGAQKALENFITGYGVNEGVRIFIAKADEQGSGSTLRQKVNSVYKRGAKLNA
jgi:hypothetical protein